MLDQPTLEFRAKAAAFMAERLWQQRTCKSCGKTYFSKTADESPSCERGACSDGRAFLKLPKRKRPVPPAEVGARLAKHFSGLSYEHAGALPVADARGTTDLVVAGVQLFDGAIHRGEAVKEGRLYIGQPSIRMQFQELISSHDGISTAFVNVCTEKAHETIDGHLLAVDHWLGALSGLGLHMKDVTLVSRSRTCDWGTGPFENHEIFFVYGGLELGDAAYAVVPTKYGEPLPISDIGFGLERIAWALNKTERYYDLLRPGEGRASLEITDALRTLALLSLCGVQPSNKGPGLQLRRLAKLVCEKQAGADIHGLLTYYLRYWASFLKGAASDSDAIRTVRLEIDRFANLLIAERGGFSPPREETTEEYFHRLVYTLGADPQTVRSLIEVCNR